MELDDGPQLLVVLEPAEEGGFIVHVPALPEICTEGDDEAEALAMAKDAIELVIASRLERGEPVPVEHACCALQPQSRLDANG